MITYKEACTIVKKENPTMLIRSAMDYKNFYLFVLAPIYISDDDDYMTGTIFPIVDKKTGTVSLYDILEDYDAYENAKIIKDTR